MPETPNIQPVGAGDWARFMLYSFPGWGKTSLIGEAAAAGHRTLIIHSSLDLMPARIMSIPGVEQITADTWEKMDEALDYCRMQPNFPYEWVWWDCISIAQDVLLDDIWEATKLAYPKRNVKTIAGGKDRGEYWTNADRIQMWVRHMVGANRFHFGIAAHPMEGQHPSNDEGGTLLRPFVQVKNMPEKICGYMNLVGFLEVMEKDDQPLRRLHFKENPRFYAKDLYDAFPTGYLDNPSIDEIMQRVEKARGRRLGLQQTPARGRGGRAATTAPTRGRRGARA